MRAMKDSGVEWLGEVPEGWGITPTKHLFYISKTIAGKTGYDVLSVTQRGLKVKDIKSGEGQIAADYSHYQLVEPGDFAMNHMDLLTGWIDIAKQNGVTSPDYRVFKSRTEHMDKRFFLRVFQYYYSGRIFYGFCKGISNRGRWRLPADAFGSISLPVPPLDEQRRIADFLDEKCAQIDRAITSAEQSIQEYIVYKKGLVTEVVQRADGRKMRLRHLCSRVFDGPFGSHLKSTDYIDEGIRVVRLENLRYMSFDDSKRSYVSQEKYETIARHTVLPADLIMATFVAKEVQVASLPEGVEFAVNKADCVGLRLKSEMCVGRYIQYALSSNEVFDYLRSNLHGTTRDRVNTSQIKEIKLPVPPLDEQRRIADFLDEKCAQIDQAVEAKQAIIDELKAYKKSLIYEVVTGKREV